MRAVAFGPQQGARDRTLAVVEDHLLPREPGVRRLTAPLWTRNTVTAGSHPRSARSLSRSRPASPPQPCARRSVAVSTPIPTSVAPPARTSHAMTEGRASRSRASVSARSA
jgi:hypothetical protein